MSIKDNLRKALKASEVGNSVWRFFHRSNLLIQRIFDDETYFKRKYKHSSGKDLDFSNLQTFDEKQLWLKMYYRNPLCVTCSDKYLVRTYVAQKGLESLFRAGIIMLFGIFWYVEVSTYPSLDEFK